MRARGRAHLAAAVLLGAALAAAGPGAAGAGPVIFSGLAACPDSGRLVFTARDADLAATDTLSLDPGTGTLAWHGGPVRGLALGAGDTVYAAVLTGVAVLAGERPAGFLPWVRVPTGRLEGPVSAWPRLRVPGLPPSAEAAEPAGPAIPFPERYHPLADSTLLFLTSAEHAGPQGRLLLDLHGRGPDGVEWILARNLEVRRWVVSSDGGRWALAARVHRPDYGGEVLEVVLAGVGVRTERFDLGRPRSLAWDPAGTLWILTEDGALMHITPGSGAWTVNRVRPAASAAPCPPAPPERVWVWMSPGRYRNPDAALLAADAYRPAGAQGTRRAWVARDDAGAYRPVWGGMLDRESLLSDLPEAPVPGAAPARVRVDAGQISGTVARVRMNGQDGVAALRHVVRDGRTLSEIWWRFLTRPRWVRLAGPWGPNGSRGTALTPPPPVDTPDDRP